MAIAKDAFSSSFNSYTNTLTWAHTCSGSDRILVVGAVLLGDDPPAHDIVSLTYNGVGMTKLTDIDNSGVHVELWYMVNPPTGSNNIVITHDGTFTTSWCLGMATSLTGVDQSSPIDVSNSAADTGNALSIALTTTGANRMLVDVAGKYNTDDTLVPNGSQTGDVVDTVASGWGLVGAMSTKAAPSAGSNSTSYTYSDSNDGAMISIALVEASAGELTDDIVWKGYTWKRRLASVTGAPTYNGQWSGSNVSEPDGNDYITLSLTNPGDSPVAAEFYSDQQGWGYGTYTSVVDASLDDMHKHVVLGGMFTYDSSGTAPVSNNEIDAHETSAWGEPTAVQLGHVYWYNDGGNKAFIAEYEDVPSDHVQTHVMTWAPGQIIFRSYIGEGTGGTLIKETIKTENIPIPNNERVHYNLWVFNEGGDTTDADGATPIDVIIRDFSFTPLEAQGDMFAVL